MLIISIVIIFLIPSHTLYARPTCVSIEDDDKTSVIATCTFMNLKDIPNDLPADSVLSLDVSNNQLKVIQNSSFSRYVNLKAVTLSYNEIRHVRQDTFSNLYQLREVDLSYNELEYIHSEIFSNNPVLESVSLAGNPLVYFPVDSPVLISSSLTSLDLSSCSLTSVHLATFSRLPKLIELDLGSNHMRVIYRVNLETLENLKVVKLKNNRWECSCQMRDVLQWASLLSAHSSLQKPIKCFERGLYRTLWSQAKGEKPCSFLPATGGEGVQGIFEDGTMWYKVPNISSEVSMSLSYKECFMSESLILVIFVPMCVFVSWITIMCSDWQRSKKKVLLYEHLEE